MINCIFDWKRTLYDPDLDCLIAGAKEVLAFLAKQRVSCVLIGKGGPEMAQKVRQLKLAKNFEQIIFTGLEKDPAVFEKFIYPTAPLQTLVIGDRTRAEIEIGNMLGATTIWVRQGRFANEEPLNPEQKADFTVNDLMALQKLLQTTFIAYVQKSALPHLAGPSN